MSLPRPLPNPVSDLMDLVINRESCYPMHSLITSYLGVNDMRNVQLVCRKTSQLYANTKKTQWNINTSLQPFFRDTQTFRSVQAQTETLIGSKFAGRFFRRLQDKPVLPLHTQAGENVDTLISYLKNDGYALDKAIAENVEFGFSQISVFSKTSGSDDSKIPVTLRHCVYSPIDTFLRSCMCSSRAFFISWNKAYCLFPTATILERTSHLMAPMSDTGPSPTIARMKRESEEGIIVKTGEWMVKAASESHLGFAFARSVGDKLSWVMKLDLTDVTHATVPYSPLDDARFSVGVKDLSSIVSFLGFRYDVLVSCSLKHTYICLSRNNFVPATQCCHERRNAYREQMQQLERVLNAETSMQLTTLGPDDQPPQYLRIIGTRGNDHTVKGQFKVPPSWNYFDAEIQAELRRITKQLLATDPCCPQYWAHLIQGRV